MPEGEDQRTGDVTAGASIDTPHADGLIEDLPPREFLRGLFHLLFRREPVLTSEGAFVNELEDGTLGPRQLVEWLIHSDEWSTRAPMTELGPSLHASRGAFIRMLPRARRILDLGGTALGVPSGAFVSMGYPYAFEQLVIVDLPSHERHPLYREESESKGVATSSGSVIYNYHSMTDLSRYPDASFDLVYSGQSIEHVTQLEADRVLRQVRRVLLPGGTFALDTPNAKLTRLQQDAFIDPDHKHEYSHEELTRKLRGNGFQIAQAFGINYGGESVRQGHFDPVEIATRRGLFAEISDCYLLGYVCRRPSGAGPRSVYERLAWQVERRGGLRALPRKAVHRTLSKGN